MRNGGWIFRLETQEFLSFIQSNFGLDADGLAAHERRAAIINTNGTTNTGVFGRAARARLFAPASVEGPLLRLQRMSSGQFAFVARRLRERCVFGVGKSALFFRVVEQRRVFESDGTADRAKPRESAASFFGAGFWRVPVRLRQRRGDERDTVSRGRVLFVESRRVELRGGEPHERRGPAERRVASRRRRERAGRRGEWQNGVDIGEIER